MASAGYRGGVSSSKRRPGFGDLARQKSSGLNAVSRLR